MFQSTEGGISQYPLSPPCLSCCRRLTMARELRLWIATTMNKVHTPWCLRAFSLDAHSLPEFRARRCRWHRASFLLSNFDKSALRSMEGRGGGGGVPRDRELQIMPSIEWGGGRGGATESLVYGRIAYCVYRITPEQKRCHKGWFSVASRRCLVSESGWRWKCAVRLSIFVSGIQSGAAGRSRAGKWWPSVLCPDAAGKESWVSEGDIGGNVWWLLPLVLSDEITQWSSVNASDLALLIPDDCVRVANPRNNISSRREAEVSLSSHKLLRSSRGCPDTQTAGIARDFGTRLKLEAGGAGTIFSSFISMQRHKSNFKFYFSLRGGCSLWPRCSRATGCCQQCSNRLLNISCHVFCLLEPSKSKPKELSERCL